MFQVVPLFVTTFGDKLVSSVNVPDVLAANNNFVFASATKGLVGTVTVAPVYNATPFVNLKLVIFPGQLSPVGDDGLDTPI